MKLTKLQIGIIASFAVIIIFMIIGSSIFKKELIRNHKISSARIIDISSGGRGQLGITLYFEFYLKERKISGISSFKSSELNYNDAKSFFVGRMFPVVYSPESPNNNYLLIRKKDFEQFEYAFPDSLMWVSKFLKTGR